MVLGWITSCLVQKRGAYLLGKLEGHLTTSVGCLGTESHTIRDATRQHRSLRYRRQARRCWGGRSMVLWGTGVGCRGIVH